MGSPSRTDRVERGGGRGVAALAAGLAIGMLGALAPAGLGQVQGAGGAAMASTGHPQRDALRALSRPVTVDLRDQRLEDVMAFIADFTGADLEVMWRGDRHADGLDPEQLITLRANNVRALALIERVLDRADTDEDESTWQLTRSGTVQIGPKSRLNRYKRTEMYDISDLLTELPRYDEVPSIDLQSVLQSGRGGGGQSPFRDDQDDEDRERKSLDDRALEIIEILQRIVEPQQWVDAGGEAASLEHWRGTLIITAPDYIHRQINGYSFWPASLTRAGMTNGRRWVSLNMDTGIATLDGFGRQPVSAVVGGEIIRSDDPPGGGG